MQPGRINLIVGAVGIVLASVGGLALGATYNALYEEGFYMIDLTRSLLKAGHTHGQPLAMYNLIFALLIGRVALSERSRKIASWLAAMSMIMPIGLLLRGLTDGAMTFAPVALLGGLCFAVSAGFLLAGSREWGAGN